MLWKRDCGTAKYPGELKADGSPMHFCSYKFPGTYFAIIDKDGNNLRTSKTLGDLKIKPGEIAIKKTYSGCPFYFP